MTLSGRLEYLHYSLGGGIDLCWYPNAMAPKHSSYKNLGFGLCFTSAKIHETNNTLVIVGLAFGLDLSVLEASYVFGGKMTPIKE